MKHISEIKKKTQKNKLLKGFSQRLLRLERTLRRMMDLKKAEEK